MATNNEIDSVIDHVKQKATNICLQEINSFFKFRTGTPHIGDIQRILNDADDLITRLENMKNPE